VLFVLALALSRFLQATLGFKNAVSQIDIDKGSRWVMPWGRVFNITLLLVFAGVIAVYFTQRHLYYERVGPLLEPANHAYWGSTAVDECADPLATETGDEIGNLETAGGINFEVRVPANYRYGVRHPLLVVYAPGGSGRFASERLVSITAAATSAGFIIAFADDRPLSIDTILDLGNIPELVSQRWCVDPRRIFLTGHSNGGTVASALAFLPKTPFVARAIAPSAAGISGADFEILDCPKPMSVMIMHSADDQLFPEYGSEAAAWWAGCNQCDVARSTVLANRCISYLNCAPGVETVYCEGRGPHTRWPDLNDEVLEFFLGFDDD